MTIPQPSKGKRLNALLWVSSILPWTIKLGLNKRKARGPSDTCPMKERWWTSKTDNMLRRSQSREKSSASKRGKFMMKSLGKSPELSVFQFRRLSNTTKKSFLKRLWRWSPLRKGWKLWKWSLSKSTSIIYLDKSFMFPNTRIQNYLNTRWTRIWCSISQFSPDQCLNW